MELENTNAGTNDNKETKAIWADNQRKKIKNIIKREQEQYDEKSLREYLRDKIAARQWIFERDRRWVQMDEIKRIGKLINSSSKNIQRLDIKRILCKNFEGLKYIGTEIKRLDALRHLSINFQTSGGSRNVGLYNIGQGLKRNNSLESISLHLSGCQELDDKRFGFLVEGLRGKTSLLKLFFDISS